MKSEFDDRLGLHDLTLVMQDWGGPIGLGLAERRPELVGRVILGSTWAWRTSKSEPRGKFSVIFGGPIGEFIQVNFPGLIGRRNANATGSIFMPNHDLGFLHNPTETVTPLDITVALVPRTEPFVIEFLVPIQATELRYSATHHQ